MTALAAGALYFLLVFGAGFLFGVARTLWIVPRIGARRAEMLESPFMLAVSVWAAWGVIRWLQVPADLPARSVMGSAALALMLAAEFGLMLRLRGLSFKAYWAGRDRVSAAVYYLLLVVFAVLPAFVGR